MILFGKMDNKAIHYVGKHGHERVEPQQTTFTGEMIYDAAFWNPVPNTTYWYKSMSKRMGLL